MKKFHRFPRSDISIGVIPKDFYPIALEMLLHSAMALENGKQTLIRYELSGQAYFFNLSDFAHLVNLMKGLLSETTRSCCILLFFDDAHLFYGDYDLSALV